jgi:Ni/Fe-hydrogenase subunit HybB-like protein
MNFALPLLILMWNPIRRSIAGPTVVAAIVLLGNLIDRIRLTSAAFSQPDSALLGHAHELHEVPAAYIPGISDILILVGLLAGALALVLWAARYLPFPSVAEVVGGLWLRAHQPFKHARLIVIGKTE